MIAPNILFITQEELDRLVLDAEAKIMKERAEKKIEDRETCVQFWVHIAHKLVPENYLYELEMSYRNAGWNRVRVEFQKDRTESIYVYLAM